MKLCKFQVIFAFIVLGATLFIGPFTGLVLMVAFILWSGYCNTQKIANFLSLFEEKYVGSKIFHDEEEKEN